MKKVAERLNILKMTPEEKNIYQTYRNESLKERDYIASAEERGLEKGIEKGREEERMALAKKMLAKGKPIEEIIEFTDLTKDELNKLKSKI